MAWFKVDDGFYTSQKVMRIPRSVRNEAIGAWILIGTWSADKMTDGFIPDWVIAEFDISEEALEALYDCGLWDVIDEGTQYHDWHEYQPTREQMMAKREETHAQKVAAGKKGAEARWHADSKAIAENSTAIAGDSPVPVPVPLNTSSSELDSSDTKVFSYDVYTICDQLAQLIRDNGNKVGTVGVNWWKAADRLIRLDGHSIELIEQVMVWCQQDEFWQGNILSMPKFREKFDMLRTRMQNEKPKQATYTGYAPGVVTRGEAPEGRRYAADIIEDWES